MVGVTDTSTILLNVSTLIKALSAAGFIFLLWIVFQIISVIYNRKKTRILKHLVVRLDEVHKKLNHLEEEVNVLLKKKKS